MNCIKLFGPEGIYLEYKVKLPSTDILARAMISFSNTKGGRLILGVEDKTGELVGIKTDIDIEEYIMNVASENCEPIISPIVEFKSYDEKLVVIIDVSAGPLKPYHLKGKATDESVFIRIGSTIRRADKNHIQQLMREAVNESFDKLIVPNTSSADLDFDKIGKYQVLKNNRIGTPKEKITETFLKKIGIKKEASKGSPITFGGMLLFGKSVQTIPALFKAHVKIARFKGNETGVIVDHDLLEGTIDTEIEGAVQFLRKHMFVSGKIEQLKREDRFSYPMAAIREVLTNAVIHRDYSRAANEAIMCRLFDNRLEVESPGLLPLGVRVENLGDVQNTRNPLIGRLMFEMGYFDEWGQGIKRMIEACRENGNPIPYFEEKDSTFKVTIYARNDKIRLNIEDRRGLLLNYLKNREQVQSHEYQNFTSMSSAQAAKDFKMFVKEGIIKRIGKGRSVKYVLA